MARPLPKESPDNMKKAFVVRHKVSGWVIPDPVKTASGKSSSSWVELADPMNAIPRLFRSRKSAMSFIGQWCRGRISYSEDTHTPDVEPVRSRKKEELEIVRAFVTW